ncbi:response regulator [Polynucleobacter sp. JS-Safj-400b-B2]|uniref:ATP-binding protein n=1 Tax=Polynucleobacter sp. JS-Safj-400b-B2 TaxID=2576921 RepID=UPI001C0C6433|nr:ATP-binding protein [Polynucleobacter sp. JS-Safj-400b-B2]MBU3627165.1 response regulator [Polynucleobacter sp. JS-Safj-400b-B2]
MKIYSDLKYKSITKILIEQITFFSAFALLISLGVQGIFLQFQTNNHFNEVIDRMGESTIPMMALALWDIEPAALQEQVNQLAKWPEIGHVSVQAATGQTFEAGDKSLIRKEDTRELPIIMVNHVTPLGKIFISTNPKYFWAEFLGWTLEIVIGYLLLITTICCIIFYVLRRNLSKPLQKIADFAANLSSENLTVPLRVERPPHIYEDEISQLESGFAKLQSGLLHHIERLDDLLIERAVTQRRLEQASKAAEAANTAKSQFLATISHELRTPLNGILGMAQLLQEPHLTEQGRIEYAQIIVDSSRALNTLVDDLLDITQIEENRLSLRSEPCNIKSITTDVVSLFEQYASKKSIALSIEWGGPENQLYRTDGLRVRQMLSNLISNAIKFTSGGFVHIKVQEVEHTGVEAILLFSVTDSGVGIPQDKLNTLFKRFSQIDSTLSRQFNGVGLGLFIVQNLASRMGGEVGVESTLGQGSSFWFTIQTVVLDVAEPLPSVLTLAEKEQIAGSSLNLSRSNPTSPVIQHFPHERMVMVVEDNPINQRIVGEVVSRLGIQFECFNNGLDAFSALTKGICKPSLILMDIQMPGMDGLQTTVAIRAWEKDKDIDTGGIPVIGLTAGLRDASIQDCIQSGMNEVLLKPVDLDILQNVILEKIA